MRLIKTESSNKIGVIAATSAELHRLKTRRYVKAFNDSISAQPVKNEEYQCFVMAYTFEDAAQARLFRLAYAQAMRRAKHIKRTPVHKIRLCKWSRARDKKRAVLRRKRKARKRERKRYYKLLPIVRAGNTATIEQKARELARTLLISDLL